MIKISVAIITLNEANHIIPCLDSVSWADEVVVMDSGSCDQTVALARDWGAKVVHQDWLGFGPQKNQAVAYCRGEWVLSIDADERVSDGLRKAICQAVDNSQDVDFYEIRRYSNILGHIIRYGDWGRDWIVRLFRRQAGGAFSSAQVHESLQVPKQAQVKRLSGYILHYPYTSMTAWLDKVNHYTTLLARDCHSPPSKLKLLVGPWFKFWRSYVLKLGFLDGWPGLIVARMGQHYVFYKYFKKRYPYLVNYSDTIDKG